MRIPARRLLALSLAAGVLLAACGDDSVDPVAEPTATDPPDETTVPGATTDAPGSAGYDHPAGADEVVIRIDQEGGFAPVEALFARIPNLLVTGDGHAFAPAPQTAIFPGPLVPAVQVTDVGEDGIQGLLALADEHGLLQEREYEAPANIADATDTVVTLTVGGRTFVHRAYALGLEGGLDPAGGELDDPARAELSEFIAAATAAVDPASEVYEPTEYLMTAMVTTDLTGYDVEPTIVAWPLDVALADAGECTLVSAPDADDLLADATQLTFFEQDGVVYRLAVKPALPGDGC